MGCANRPPPSSLLTTTLMKRIRCPKCDEAILFDETRYEQGRVLIFECPECHKQFKIRIPQAKKDEEHSCECDEENREYGYVIVLENSFQLKQVLLLHQGDNVIGREVKGTAANAPIKTVDPSIDTTHCIIRVNAEKGKTTKFVLRDAPSNTGTFLHNEILTNKDRVNLKDGDIITIGAATLIFQSGRYERD